MEEFFELTAEQLKKEVCKILQDLGMLYRTEVYSEINSSIIGKKRRVDVAIVDHSENILMHIECKSQNTAGS